MATLHCQKCRTPIKLDSSLQSLNPASFKILADAAPALEPQAPDPPRSAAAIDRRQQYDEVAQQQGPPVHKRNTSAGTPHRGAKLDPGMSYIDITESVLSPGGPTEHIQNPTKSKRAPKKAEQLDGADGSDDFSQRLETTTRLFEILSARSDIDHPVCTECTELLLSGLQQRCANVIRERDAYIDFLKRAQQDTPTDEEKASTKRALADARAREQKAFEELESLEAQKSHMESLIAALDAESQALDAEESTFWQTRNTFTSTLSDLQETHTSLTTKLTHTTHLLDNLQRTNVFNDSFCIGHDGQYGTINGLRLGRLADHPVEWPEINAALGQAVLLLVVVSEKLGYKVKGYQLLPIGSTSKLVLEDPDAVPTGHGKQKGTIHEIYSSGALPFGLGAFYGGFDTAMYAFLECLRQVGEHVETTSSTSQASGAPGLEMPYEIVTSKDVARIGGVKMSLGGVGREVEWTKACKYLLTCCKFLLAHASHVSAHGA